MFLSDLSVRRPVTATMMVLSLVVFGLIAYGRLEVREVPDVEIPVVTVTASFPGASPEVVETEITDVIEEAVSTIEGIRTLTSVSGEGTAQVTIEFALERDIDNCANDVRDKVNAARRTLPADLDPPVVAKVDLNAQAIMWLALTSTRHDPIDISTYAENVMKEKIQRIPGVGSILLGGSRRLAIRVWLNGASMAAHGVTAQDVILAFQREHVEIPSGRIESSQREFVIKTEGEFKTPLEMEEMVIRVRGGVPVKLKDIGRVEAGSLTYRNLARFNQEPSIGLGVLKQSKANTVEVARAVKASLPEFTQGLPEGMNLRVAFDSSRYIEASIKAVEEDFLLGGVFAGAVIFFFLLSVRSTVIAALAIPASIIATFTAMYFLGFSLNNFTFLAFSVAVGVVIDDAIVVLENIYRHMEEGRPRLESARTGAAEISFAALAATLAIFAVFLPVAFMQGMMGRFFHEFGMTISIAVLVSFFVAMTLTPMLCSRALRVHRPEFFLLKAIDRFWAWVARAYRTTLGWALNTRFLVLMFGAATLAGSLFLATKVLRKEFFPPEDKGSFVIQIEGPQGATLEYTDAYLKQIEKILGETPEVSTYFAALGLAMAGAPTPHTGISFVRLSPTEERSRGQFEVIAELRRKLSGVTGLNTYVIPIPTVRMGRADAALQYIIQAEDFEELKKYEAIMKDKMRQIPGLIDVNSDLKINKPEISLEIDRAKIADLGLTVREVAETLRILMGEDDVAKFKIGGKQYDIIPRLEAFDRSDPQSIDRLYVRAPDGRLTQLSSVVRRVETVSPTSVNRYSRERSVLLTANLMPGKALGDALKDVDRLAKETLPPTFRTRLGGQTREFKDSIQNLMFAFFLALVTAYMLLAAQFESLVHPLTVMLSLPLALIGGLGGLAIFGQTLNLFSAIGIITLMGLAKKNAILLVDFAIVRQREGLSARDAMLSAGPIRLRPILMTSAAMIFGVLPIIFSHSAGSEVRRPMGLATGCGMLTSTAFTLYVVPVLYTYMDDLVTILRRLFGKESAREARQAPEPGA